MTKCPDDISKCLSDVKTVSDPMQLRMLPVVTMQTSWGLLSVTNP